MKQIRTALFVLWILLQTPICAQKAPFRVMFYNVENLFDCKHDSLKNDEEFLPSSIRAWTPTKLKTKLFNIAKVITAVGGWNAPQLVGLCEVENRVVLTQLTAYSPLKALGYRFIHFESDDERGVDVALLYQRSDFKLLDAAPIKIPTEKIEKRSTRDILHATGTLQNGDTLDVFVCHFPSRMGGEKESQPARELAASTLKEKTDSLVHIRKTPYILIMGDFNDESNSNSLTETLQAKPTSTPIIGANLYNLFAKQANYQTFASYKYQSSWSQIDQFIVSGTLLEANRGLHINKQRATTACFDFLLERDNKYLGMKPFRTYYGMKYQAGYSDHLPIFLDINIKTN